MKRELGGFIYEIIKSTIREYLILSRLPHTEEGGGNSPKGKKKKVWAHNLFFVDLEQGW